jgi:hypothetical protein
MTNVHGNNHKVYGHYRMGNAVNTDGYYRLPQGNYRTFYGYYLGEKIEENTVKIRSLPHGKYCGNNRTPKGVCYVPQHVTLGR